MLEPQVSRTPEFLHIIDSIFRGHYLKAMDELGMLRQQYINDGWSQVEIDRWIGLCLERSGRIEEALDLLLKTEPQLKHFQCDLSHHYFCVITLLAELGKKEEIVSYSKQISEEITETNALGHLDWMQKLVESTEISHPSAKLVIATCASLLGLQLPTNNLEGASFRQAIETCITTRDQANERYQNFWIKVQQLKEQGASEVVIYQEIERYNQAEPCPIFRGLAQDLGLPG